MDERVAVREDAGGVGGENMTRGGGEHVSHWKRQRRGGYKTGKGNLKRKATKGFMLWKDDGRRLKPAVKDVKSELRFCPPTS